MELMKGVTLVADAGLERQLREAIEISSGTRSANGLAGYGADAIVPNADWRRLTTHEEQVLFGAAASAALPSVGLVSASTELLAVAATTLGSARSAADESSVFGDEVRDVTNERLLAALGRCAAARGSIARAPRVLVRSPNLLTVARDEAGLLGLHVDEWFDELPVPRESRPGRIVVNLGRQARYLVFVNVLVTEMPALMCDGPPVSGADGTQIGRQFMRAHPSYPVCRLRMDPGFGYIAPTENLVHDASLVGMTEEDAAGHVLGTFWCVTSHEATSAGGAETPHDLSRSGARNRP